MKRVAPRALTLRNGLRIASGALLAAFGLCGCGRGAVPPSSLLLEPGAVLERDLAGGERHGYRLALTEGEYLHLEVDQRGVDVMARLAAPGGGTLLEVDSPSDDLGPETLLWVATETGEHNLEVEAFPGRGGRYAVTVKALRPATEEDRLRAATAAAFSAATALVAAGELNAAERAFSQAGEAWGRLGVVGGLAHVEDQLGRLASLRPDLAAAADHHQRAAALFAAAGDERWRGISLSQRGTALFHLGELAAAQSNFEEALVLRRSAGDSAGAAALLHKLAHIHQLRGEPGRALELYEASLERRRQRGEEAHETLHNLGVLLLALGRPEDALDRLREAEAASHRSGNERHRTGTLLQIGRALNELGEPAKAVDCFEQALALARQGSDRRAIGLAQSHLGVLARQRGDLVAAQHHHEEAWRLFRELGDDPAVGAALTSLGTVALAVGDPAAARRRFAFALPYLPAETEPQSRAINLVGGARAALRLGRPDEALEAVEAAVKLVESPRLRLSSLALRTSYSTTARPTFELWVEVLMALHRRQPTAGWDRQALSASERGRARSFLDAVALARAGPSPAEAGAPRPLAEAESASRRRLNALETMRLEPGRSASPPALAAALEREIRRTLSDLERVERQLQATAPRRAALHHLEPLTASEIQRRLPPDGALLELALGAERSQLWVLTAEGLTSHELPGRQELESAARQTYELLTRSHRREAEGPVRGALCRMSRLLLAPAAEAIAGRHRLLIVADGALLYLPFAALPDPAALATGDCPAAPPLAARFAVTQLPSASLLAALAPATGRRWQGEVAVIGDPVFAPPETLGRLPFSRLEAEAVLAQAPVGQGLALLGPEASKQAVLSGRLGSFRRLHFATHGVVNPLHAELSGLVLSTVDEAGRHRDGFLWAHEIAGLELPAELVVLSACRTALGVEMPGEGLVGLTRSFFEAGARSLLVSLWSVDDRSTAELMRRFYGELFTSGSEPAAALARAQAAMASEPAWRAPYHWAGFVLQGAPH